VYGGSVFKGVEDGGGVRSGVERKREL
jgi:hypothetical protein